MLLVSGNVVKPYVFLGVRNVSVSESRVSFSLGDLETSSPGVHFSELTFDAYVPNKQLCVYTTLQRYLQRTFNVMETETRVFSDFQAFFLNCITRHITMLDQELVSKSRY